MTVRTLVWARIANHRFNAAIVAFLLQSIRRSRTDLQASGVGFVIGIEIRTIRRVCIIIGFATGTIIFVPSTRHAERIAIATVGLIYGVTNVHFNVKLILPLGAVTLADKRVSPFIVLIGA